MRSPTMSQSEPLPGPHSSQTFNIINSPPPPVVILNPAGANGKARRLRRMLEERLRAGRGELVLTARRGDGERLAREAALAGRDVVAVGGDGTVLEVGSGMLAAGRRVARGL